MLRQRHMTSGPWGRTFVEFFFLRRTCSGNLVLWACCNLQTSQEGIRIHVYSQRWSLISIGPSTKTRTTTQTLIPFHSNKFIHQKRIVLKFEFGFSERHTYRHNSSKVMLLQWVSSSAHDQRWKLWPLLTNRLPTWLLYCLIHRLLTDQPTDSLTHWLTSLLTHWLTSLLTHRLTGSSTDRLTHWLTDQLTVSQTDWLINWLSHTLTDELTVSQTDWSTDCLTDWLINWLSHTLTDQLSHRLTDQLTVSQTDWSTDCLTLTDQPTVSHWLINWPSHRLTNWSTDCLRLTN